MIANKENGDKVKKIFILATIIVIGVVLSFVILTNSKGKQEYFDAVVLEVYDDTAVVEVIACNSDNKNNIISNGKNIIINTNTIAEKTEIALKEGDEIRIVYNMNSIKQDPLRIEIVYAIYMSDELTN